MNGGFPLFMRETARKLRGQMRVSKGILLKLGGSFAVVLCAFTALKLTLQSDDTQARIRKSLSSALGMDVQFEKLRTSLFGKVRLSGLKASNAHGASLSAREVHVQPRLFSLLQASLVLSEVRIDEARLTWVERAPQASQEDPASGTKTSQETRSGMASFLKELLHDKEHPSIRRLVLNRGNLDWIDAGGHTLIQAESVQLDLNTDSTGRGSGRISIARGAVVELLSFRSLQSPIELNEGVITLPALSATSGDGQIEASLALQTRKQGTPMRLNAMLKEINLATMTEELPSVRFSGIANGNLEIEGLATQSSSIHGKAELRIENGFFKGLGVLQLIGQIFQINELSNLKVKSAVARMTIADRSVRIDELSIQSDDMSFLAPGVMGFDRQLSLNARLSLPERMLSGKNMQPFNSRFSPVDAEGNRSIDFAITGSIDKPRTNLLEKITGEGVGNVLQHLIGNFLKPRQPEPKPEATPAAKSGDTTPK
jgi:hypothetical protein